MIQKSCAVVMTNHNKQDAVTYTCHNFPGAQELPTDFDPSVFMDAVYADLEAACPAGIEKCECMNAPGTFKIISHEKF